MDLISVVIPVYNVEEYLARCVNSVRNQTYQNLEIILVDDGSTDGCPKICDMMQQKDPRIKVIHKVNAGLGMARNSGLEIASGAYITFVDSDDWISEKHVENLYREVTKVETDVVIGGFTGVTSQGEKTPSPVRLEKKVYMGDEIRNKIVLPLIGAEPQCLQDVEVESSSCMNLYRMAVIIENSLRFRSEKVAVAEDLFFNIDFFCCAKRAVVIDEVGYYYFKNLNSISWKYDAKRIERTIKFYEVIHQQIDQYRLDNVVGYRADRTFLMKVRLAIRNIIRSGMSEKEKRNEIRKVLRNPVLQKVLGNYPIHSMIPVMRILAEAMQKKCVIGVYWLMRFREATRKKVGTWEVLKSIGTKR